MSCGTVRVAVQFAGNPAYLILDQLNRSDFKVIHGSPLPTKFPGNPMDTDCEEVSVKLKFFDSVTFGDVAPTFAPLYMAA
jgi:hypothetical protein